jgi:hypothetical protein
VPKQVFQVLVDLICFDVMDVVISAFIYECHKLIISCYAQHRIVTALLASYGSGVKGRAVKKGSTAHAPSVMYPFQKRPH